MLRFPAEWEKQSFVQITFPHENTDWSYMYQEAVTCFVNIIHTISEFEPVLIGCKSIETVKSILKETTKFPLHFVELDSNDTWARDHGAITLLNDDIPILMDFKFNGWGQKFDYELDNRISKLLNNSILSNNQFTSIDFVLEGGSIDSNGKGVLLTTSACLLSKFRNPEMNKSSIEAFLKDTLAAEQIIWLDHGFLKGDDTDSHIDTLARFINENTIVYVKCIDPSDEHFNSLNKMEDQLKEVVNLNGEPFDLIALPFPDACFDQDSNRLPATYANFLFVNGGLLIPQYGVSQDSEALNIFKQLFPNLKVIGFDCRPLIEQGGSLHCISMQYPAQVQLN